MKTIKKMPSHCFINSVLSSGVYGKLIKSYHRLVNQSTVTDITYYEHVPRQFLLEFTTWE